jgi:transposase
LVIRPGYGAPVSALWRPTKDENTNWNITVNTIGYGSRRLGDLSSLILWCLEHASVLLTRTDITKLVMGELETNEDDPKALKGMRTQVENALGRLRAKGLVRSTSLAGNKLGWAPSNSVMLPTIDDRSAQENKGGGASDRNAPTASTTPCPILTDGQWVRLVPLLPGNLASGGVAAQNTRRFIDAVLRTVWSGSHWNRLPSKYGKWSAVYGRFNGWAHLDVWRRVFASLSPDFDEDFNRRADALVRLHHR